MTVLRSRGNDVRDVLGSEPGAAREPGAASSRPLACRHSRNGVQFVVFALVAQLEEQVPCKNQVERSMRLLGHQLIRHVRLVA